MHRLLALLLLMLGVSLMAPCPPPAPEIDPTSGANALALIAGGLVILRSSCKK